MRPVLFQLGDANVYAYGVMVIVSMAAGFGLAIVAALRAKLQVGPVLMAATLFLMGLGFGGKVAALFELRELTLRSVLGGGLYLAPGLLLGVLIAIPIPILFKQSVGATFDALAPALLGSLALGRVGCFLAGCCYGRPTDLPWAMHFPNLPMEFGGHGAHPTQLYLFLALGSSSLVLLSVLGRGGFRGQLALLATAVFALVTMSERTFRYSEQRPPTWPYFAWGLVLITSLVLAFVLRPKNALSSGSASA